MRLVRNVREKNGFGGEKQLKEEKREKKAAK